MNQVSMNVSCGWVRTSTLFTIIYLALVAYLLVPEVATGGDTFAEWPILARICLIALLILPSVQRVTVMGVEEKEDWRTIRETLMEHKTAKCVTALKLLNGMSVYMEQLVRADALKSSAWKLESTLLSWVGPPPVPRGVRRRGEARTSLCCHEGLLLG